VTTDAYHEYPPRSGRVRHRVATAVAALD
jgi:hypothetical protein